MNAIRPGLVSVTFRKLSAAEIIALATRAKLEGIEWGGDIHAPHGDEKIAANVGKMTRDAGLEVAAYGSYYRAGEPENSPPFDAVLASATALQAPIIRVWAGQKSTISASPAYWDAVIADLQNITEMAHSIGIFISLEFHGGTLTDSAASTLRLLHAVPALRTYWQPRESESSANCLADIQLLAQKISNFHVFHWTKSAGQTLMHPLSAGKDPWLSYLAEIAKLNKLYQVSRWGMLEFVRADDPAQFLQDSGTFHALLAATSQ